MRHKRWRLVRRKQADAKKLGLKFRGGKWYRKKKAGPWESVICDPIFGWITDEDIRCLRQTEPRIAL